MERVAVERLGSRQGDIMTRIPNSNHTWSSDIGSDVACIDSDVVLIPGNFQAYPELLFSFLYQNTRWLCAKV